MRNVLATDLGIWPTFENLNRISDAMLASIELRSSLVNYILLYDQIFIPTGNLQILPVLRLVLGETVFSTLVENNIIVLVRYDKWISYGGNGNGLNFFSVTPGEAKKTNLFHSYFTPLDECVETALSYTNPQTDNDRKNQVKNLLLEKVVSIADTIDPQSFKQETYKDIIESPYLRNFLAFRNRKRPLNKLKGIKPNQIKTFTPHDPLVVNNPEIIAVLQVAFENYILGIASAVEAMEITGDGSSLALLKAKGQRAGMPIEGRKAFAKIQEISAVPDIGMAFATGQVDAEQILDLRESKHALAFRKWLSKANYENQEEIVARYVETLGQPGLVESLPAKTISLASTISLGLIDPIAGAVANAADTFLLSKWFPQKSPRLFLKQIKTVATNTQNQKKAKINKPELKGRDRNRPCSCGSGKKFKKCCG